jgi:hypothetical protein
MDRAWKPALHLSPSGSGLRRLAQLFQSARASNQRFGAQNRRVFGQIAINTRKRSFGIPAIE